MDIQPAGSFVDNFIQVHETSSRKVENLQARDGEEAILPSVHTSAGKFPFEGQHNVVLLPARASLSNGDTLRCKEGTATIRKFSKNILRPFGPHLNELAPGSTETPAYFQP